MAFTKAQLTFSILLLAVISLSGIAVYAYYGTAHTDPPPVTGIYLRERATSTLALAKELQKAGPVDVEPKFLEIPSIGVKAPIIKVGITKKGAMNVPEKFDEVGLYKFGVKPGQKGKAVIAGHVDNALGMPAVFKNLHKLKPGDVVYVTDDAKDENGQNSILRFIVIKSELYDVDHAPIEHIFGKSDEPLLNIITCDGEWIQKRKSYSKRLVVYTKLVK
jgi:sortase A